MTHTLLAAKDRIAQPWKNGGGVTREIAVEPPGAGFDSFGWRVSTAVVAFGSVGLSSVAVAGSAGADFGAE